MFVRKILEIPFVYDFFQTIIGNKKRHKMLIKNFIGDVGEKRILELGCGTADILEYLNPKYYVGIDMDASYIQSAKKRHEYRENVEFFCTDLNDYAKSCTEKFDMILMIGVVHHLNDMQVEECFSTIKKLLNAEGEFIAFDGAYVDGMSRFERFLLDMDRGEYVRQKEEYVKLHCKYWESVDYQVSKNMMYLPFWVIVFKDKMTNE